jgi:endonuclease YncB( thermonuclease family)
MAIWTVPARVTRVVDGDTLIMDLDLGWHVWRIGERCRLRGINCPELDTEAGVVAKKFVAQTLADDAPAGIYSFATFQLIPSADVTFTSTGLDKYGRPLGIVRLSDGRLLNDVILDAGHAVRA